MKTRKIIETKCINDFDAIAQAQEVLFQAVKEQPFCKHTVTIELSNGKIFQMYVYPRLEPVYYA